MNNSNTHNINLIASAGFFIITVIPIIIVIVVSLSSSSRSSSSSSSSSSFLGVHRSRCGTLLVRNEFARVAVTTMAMAVRPAVRTADEVEHTLSGRLAWAGGSGWPVV